MEYIIDQQPNLDVRPLTDKQIEELISLEQTSGLSLEQLKRLLDTIAYYTRINLQTYHHFNIKNHPLTGLCMEATDRICYCFGKHLDIMHYCVQRVFHKYMCHSFAVGRFQTVEGVKRYIMDITYRQFCLNKEAEKERHYPYTGPGHFFYNQDLLRDLLRNGYLEVKRESLLSYGESFNLAGQEFENQRRKIYIVNEPIHYTYEEYSEALETGKMITKRK